MRSKFHGHMTMTPKRTGRAPFHGKDRASAANANTTERSANLLETSFSITDEASPCSLSSTNSSRSVRDRNDKAASRVSAFSVLRGGSCATTNAPESAARLTSNSTPVTASSRAARANAASEFSSPPADQPRCAMRCMRRTARDLKNLSLYCADRPRRVQDRIQKRILSWWPPSQLMPIQTMGRGSLLVRQEAYCFDCSPRRRHVIQGSLSTLV